MVSGKAVLVSSSATDYKKLKVLKGTVEGMPRGQTITSMVNSLMVGLPRSVSSRWT